MIINNIEFYVECLQKIVDGERFYNIVSKDIRDYDCSEDEKRTMQTIIGACIRHYIFFEYIYKTKFHIEHPFILNLLIICSCDQYFTRRFKGNDLRETIEFFVAQTDVKLSLKDFDDFFGNKTPFDLLHDEFQNKPISNKYFSLRYNVPVWIINLIGKHYSKSNALKVIKNFSNKQNYYVKVNNWVIDDKFQIDTKEFKQIGDKNLYLYEGKPALRKHRLINNFFLYITNAIDVDLFEHIHINNLDHVAVYCDIKSNIVLDLFNKSNKENTFNVFSSDFSKLIKTLEYLRKYRHEKVIFDECKPSGMRPRMIRKVNLFICIPKSSNFSSVNSSPEYLINFKQDSLNSLIAEQTETINACAEEVLIGGKLVYLTYTLDRKENEEIIEKFISEHPGWHLVEQKLFISTKEDPTVGYYAILHREL